MPAAEDHKIYLRNEIARLGSIVEAARLSGRNGSQQRALIEEHSVELAELEISSPGGPT
jgi:hypothetical protein